MPAFVDSDENQSLGVINGKPGTTAFFEERDLLQYIREAFKVKKLAYSKQKLEVSPETGQIVNNPIKQTLNLEEIMNPTIQKD